MLHLPSEYKQYLDVAAMIKVVLRRLDEKNGVYPIIHYTLKFYFKGGFIILLVNILGK